MKKIIFIPAKNSLINNKKLKVAAYCRVSTERETQKIVFNFRSSIILIWYRRILNGILQVCFMIMKADWTEGYMLFNSLEESNFTCVYDNILKQLTENQVTI